jgi:hypothetical protein
MGRMREPDKRETGMNRLSKGFACSVLASTVAFAAVAQDGGVTFTDIADGGAAGINYERVRSPRAAIRDDIIRDSPIPAGTYFGTRRPNSPQKGRGAPGVVLFDYDRDGDLDIYVPNGPGAANSLFENQFDSSGTVTFIDVGAGSGTGAADQDSSGVCFGDIDNDGDEDLYVLGTGEPNRLFENNGNGTFQDITATAGVGGGDRHAVACSFADFDNDGLLDVVVGNSYDGWEHRLTVFVAGPHYPFMEHNQLFHNLGGNVFEDRSAAAGLENVSNMAQPGASGAAFTWAIGTADYDQDGDVDIFSMDNQGGGAINPADVRGWIRLYNNDGTGNFTEGTADAGLQVQGGWMGVDFEDFDCNGTIDFFASDLGSYLAGAPSRPFMNNGDGTFTDVGIGALERTPFGWGVGTFDYDNDGDGDLIYHGGVDILSFMIADNPGTLLTNTGNCSGIFDYDAGAVLKNHVFRMVQGVAVGDLDNNGFEDIVTVSQADIVAPVNPLSFLLFVGPSNAPFDSLAMVELVFSSLQVPGSVVYVGNLDGDGEPVSPPNGTVTVEMNSGDNGNNAVAFDLLGSAGIVNAGHGVPNTPVNRDGIGAVVSFTPKDGFTRTKPVDGGASYASQSSVVANFGLGTASRGTVDVQWPGGIANRLHHVWAGERVTLPFIPCDAQAANANFGQYVRCVSRSLRDYRRAGEINIFESIRLKISAFGFFFEEQFGL